jgi:tetratricopeptide (TPR) repeat protein
MPSKIYIALICSLIACPSFAQTATELYNEGVKLESDEKYKEAIMAFKNAIVKKPDYAEALYELGWCYNELQEYKNAITYLNKAKDYEPSTAKIYFELGYAYDSDGSTDEAVTHYKKALELHPEYYSADRNLGDIYYNKEDYTLAAEYFKSYVDGVDEPDNGYYYKIGWCLNDLEKYQEAIEYLEKYDPAENDDKAKKLVEIGFAHYKRAEYNDAEVAYKQALELKPFYGTALRGLGNTYYDQDDFDNALYYYNQAVEKDEDNSKGTYYKIGWIYNDKEKYNNAVDILLKAIAYDEKDAGNREELGYAYYMLDKYDDALYQLNKAIDLDSKSKLGYYYKGLCYVALNDKTKAMEAYQQLKSVDEEQAEKLLNKINGN